MSYIFIDVFLLIGVALIILYFVMMVYGNSLYKGGNRFRNSFPYLYYMSFSMTFRLFLNILLFAGVFFMGLGEAFFFSSMALNYYQIMLAISFPLSLIALFISNILPLSYYRQHLAFYVIAVSLFGFSCISLGMIKWVHGDSGSESNYTYWTLIPTLIIGIVVLVSLVNPKLMNWAKMDRTEENGKTIYVRPKVNFLALYEWVLLILMTVVPVLLFADSLICGMLTVN